MSARGTRASAPIKEPPPRLRQRRRADGSWRIWWEPEAALRALGFEPVALDAARLTWSLREAARLNAAVDAARDGSRPLAATGRGRGRTVAALIREFRAAPEWDALAPATQRDYAGSFRVIEAKWGAALVQDFTKPIVKEWYNALYRTGRRHQAAALIRKLSLLMSFAERMGWRDDNPCARLRLVTPPGRSRVADWAELDGLLAAADAMGLPSMGLAIALAAFQGQRQKDLLEALASDFSDGWWRFVRSKRGNHGALEIHPEVAPRLEARLAAATNRAELLIHEGTAAPYSGDLFRKCWARVRARAAEAHPALATLQFRDLRRTFGHLSRIGGADQRAIGDALGNAIFRDPRLSGVYTPANAETASRAVRAIKRPEGQ